MPLLHRISRPPPMLSRIALLIHGLTQSSNHTLTRTGSRTIKDPLPMSSRLWHVATLSTSATAQTPLEQAFGHQFRAVRSGFLISLNSELQVAAKKPNTRVRRGLITSRRVLLQPPTERGKLDKELETRSRRNCEWNGYGTWIRLRHVMGSCR